jgi:hypothetical protein
MGLVVDHVFFVADVLKYFLMLLHQHLHHQARTRPLLVTVSASDEDGPVDDLFPDLRASGNLNSSILQGKI